MKLVDCRVRYSVKSIMNCCTMAPDLVSYARGASDFPGIVHGTCAFRPRPHAARRRLQLPLDALPDRPRLPVPQAAHLAQYADETLDIVESLEFRLGLLGERSLEEWMPIRDAFVDEQIRPRLAEKTRQISHVEIRREFIDKALAQVDHLID